MTDQTANDYSDMSQEEPPSPRQAQASAYTRADLESELDKIDQEYNPQKPERETRIKHICDQAEKTKLLNYCVNVLKHPTLPANKKILFIIGGLVDEDSDDAIDLIVYLSRVMPRKPYEEEDQKWIILFEFRGKKTAVTVKDLDGSEHSYFPPNWPPSDSERRRSLSKEYGEPVINDPYGEFELIG